MSATPGPPLDVAHHFRDVPDPRHPAFRDHHLLGDILLIALCAVLSGADSWEDVAEFGSTKEAWLRAFACRGHPLQIYRRPNSRSDHSDRAPIRVFGLYLPARY